MDSIATLILKQSEAIGLSLIESSEFQFVVDGAELVCNGCPGQKTVLQVTSQNKFYMKNKLVATKKDKEPIRNIVPFPSCTFIGECELMIEGDWENYSTNTFSGENECLTTDSFARCRNGGIIKIEHSGQYLSSEQIAKDSEELFKIAGKTGTSEIKKKEMGEYLSKKYGEKIVVEDFNFKRGNQVPTLDIVIRGQAKNNIYMSEQNKNILHDIENYNKNGVFFHERNKVYEYEQIQSNSVYRGVRDIDFPIKGNVYENSADYYKKRNISQSELNKTKENWNNKRIEREEREHKVLNDIKRVKNITVFDKKFDSFWLNELDVELVGSKKDKNGNTILIVNDYGNNLNKIKNQNLIKKYNKNGIKFEKSFVGRQASTLTSLYEYERLKYNYPNEYTDFFTTAPFYYTLKKAQEGIVASAYINNFPTKEGYVSNDKKSSGSKMNNKEFEEINKEVLETVETNKKRNINVELHKKINEREEGYYFKEQYKKIKLDSQTEYKNTRAANEINNGRIPGTPSRRIRGGRDTFVREISSSNNPDVAAKDFAEKLVGRQLTIDDRIKGQRISTKVDGKKVPCLKCWLINMEDGRTVVVRQAGTASGRTEPTTATVDIMHYENINNGRKTEFKFLLNGGTEQ